MDLLLHIRDEGTIKTMDFIGWTSSEESEDRKVGRKDDGHSLGCIIHIDYLSSKQTINGDYAALDRFNNILKKKTSPFNKEVFFQDNAWVHMCPAPFAKFNEFRYELLPHPVYSPDLAPYSCFQTCRNDSEKKDSPSESNSSLKQRLILKVGQIILFGRLEKVAESLDQVYRKETMLRN